MASVTGSQALTVQGVQARLRTRTVGRRLHLLEVVDSTNAAALALAQDGAPGGTVVVAESQTAGRGRQGRQWFSPPGGNLYCSLILRQSLPRERLVAWLPWVPLTSALAVARALETVSGLQAALKWPNDLLFTSRKVGGVLCESGNLGTDEAVVVIGIGVNVNQPADRFPHELRGTATSLAAEAGRSFDRTVLLAELLAELEAQQDRLLGPEAGRIQAEYRARCTTLGREVRVTLAGGEVVTGLAESIGPDGALCVAPEDGRVVEVRAGDVVHLR